MRIYLVLLSLALLQQEGRARPEAAGCKSPEALRVAEEALEQVNQDRTHGYILSLNRLYDVSHTPDKKGALLYKLSIDVLETKCHVISRKPWKQCEIREISGVPVYGKCHVSVHVDSEVKLQSYTCALRKVSDRDILRECSHCPKPVDVNDPHVREAANLSLEKFNKESRLGNHFRLEKITKARGERFYGPIYIVDFIIVETVCSNNTQPDAVKDCPPMDCQFAHRGFCVGSHRKIRFPVGQKGNSSVEVKCEIFEPQAAAAEEQAHAEAGHEHVGHQHLHSATPTPTPTGVSGALAPLGLW
ncbi:fetuin-B-like isoform X2 [Takifugu flavidus]|uniref:fetuin-B-like isoform X2 n=1 Tax=Takifugu flavidus TaxID=433684 RepID=UPI002544146C|nr:fetuin-B-like isoform X2 [Takifugu flavidus]